MYHDFERVARIHSGSGIPAGAFSPLPVIHDVLALQPGQEQQCQTERYQISEGLDRLVPAAGLRVFPYIRNDFRGFGGLVVITPEQLFAVEFYKPRIASQVTAYIGGHRQPGAIVFFQRDDGIDLQVQFCSNVVPGQVTIFPCLSQDLARRPGFACPGLLLRAVGILRHFISVRTR